MMKLNGNILPGISLIKSCCRTLSGKVNNNAASASYCAENVK